MEKLAVDTFHMSEMFRFTLLGPHGKVSPENFPLLMDGDHIDINVTSFDDSADDDSALTLVRSH